MRGYIGVKFLLAHGHYLNVVVREKDADCLTKMVGMQEVRTLVNHEAFPPPPGMAAVKWAVSWSSVQAVHTFDLSQANSPGGNYASGVSFN